MVNKLYSIRRVVYVRCRDSSRSIFTDLYSCLDKLQQVTLTTTIIILDKNNTNPPDTIIQAGIGTLWFFFLFQVSGFGSGFEIITSGSGSG